MLASPIVFIALMMIAVLLVGFGGHNSGDTSFEFFFLSIYSIIYAWLINKKKNNNIGWIENSLLIIFTLLILVASSYFGIVAFRFPSGFIIDQFIILISGIFIFSSIIVLIDCFKFYNKKIK